MSEPAETLSEQDVREAWPVLSVADRVEALRLLPRHVAEDLLFELPSREQAELILAIPDAERRSWMRLLPPDDAADLLQ
ncbi:MAG TPA: magnesium transporter, partial [Myxococcales bacterium]|nr:magnesium transporter [Myxococcales bacterium]